MAEKDRSEKAPDEYEAMVAARKLTAESSSWLDRILSNIEAPEVPEPEKQQRGHSQ